MTESKDRVKVVTKIVLYLDICSSTSILEELLRTENQKLWRNLIINLKEYLKREEPSVGFELYKFLGDGWILLFDPQTTGLDIFVFLEDLSDKFYSLYRRTIKPVLTTEISIVGITFGMDIGSCIRVRMNRQTEYIGRPLNVAGRLQGVVDQHDKKPADKGLVSKNLFAYFKDKRRIKAEYEVWEVNRTLKNISGGENYCCLKVKLK